MISASSTNLARWSSPLGKLRLNLLEGDLALKLRIARQPDLPDTPLGVLADQLKPLCPRPTRSRRVRIENPSGLPVAGNVSWSIGMVDSHPSVALIEVLSASSSISVSDVLSELLRVQRLQAQAKIVVMRLQVVRSPGTRAHATARHPARSLP